jgi:hypothetical protein
MGIGSWAVRIGEGDGRGVSISGIGVGVGVANRITLNSCPPNGVKANRGIIIARIIASRSRITAGNRRIIVYYIYL